MNHYVIRLTPDQEQVLDRLRPSLQSRRLWLEDVIYREINRRSSDPCLHPFSVADVCSECGEKLIPNS